MQNLSARACLITLTFVSLMVPVNNWPIDQKKEQKTNFCTVSKEQAIQKIKQVLYLAAPSLIMSVYPNLVTDLLEKILGDPDRYSYHNRCLVSANNFSRISRVSYALIYYSLAAYFWTKAFNINNERYNTKVQI